MAWFAAFTDDGARMRRIRLNALQGERDQLAHRRDLLRIELADALVTRDAERARLLSD
jgi:hypothetical protein